MPSIRWGPRPVAGPLLLYLLMAVAMMAPFASRRLVQSTAGDLEAHLSGIIEARRALLEGQFPIRVAPTQDDRLRYPIFQFYGNFPYTAGAVLTLVRGVSPYTAWKIVHLVGLTLAGFFTYRSALTMTGRKMPSIIAGASFVFAPYMWTDIHARFAYAETVSFMLLPPVMHFSLRAFVKGKWLSIVFAAISWNLLALSHNITYLYASAFLGLFFLSLLRPDRRGIVRLVRVGMGYALGAALTAWYAAPQLSVLKLLNVGEAAGTPIRVFSDFKTLASPWLHVPAEAADTTARLGPQVGWPILWSVGGCLVMLIASQWIKSRHRSAVRLIAFFAISFYMVWSPGWSNDPDRSTGNFWIHLPQIFWYVQFTYRILVIVILFGSILVAYALAGIFRRGMNFRSTMICLFLIGLAGSSYFPRHSKLPQGNLARLMKNPEMGEGGAGLLYLMSARGAAEQSIFHPDANVAAEAFGTLRSGWLSKHGVLMLTTPREANAILLEGTAPKQLEGPVTLTTTLEGEQTRTQSSPPGRFRIRIPINSQTLPPKPTVTLSLATDRWLRPSEIDPPAVGDDDISLHLDSLTFESSSKKVLPLIGYEQLRDRISPGAASTYVVTTNQPTLAQLPILSYPGLMAVTDHDQPIAYGNMGRLLAVELPAGSHALSVRFVGLIWANLLSVAGWAIASIVIAGAGIRRFLRWRKAVASGTALPRRASGRAAPLTPRAALAGFGSVVLGLLFTNTHALLNQLKRPVHLDVSASSSQSKFVRPEYAFDDDRSTAWAALGSHPATLNIGMSKPARINGIILECRQTALFEGWQKVRVRLFLGNQVVHEQDFDLRQQFATPKVQLGLPALRVDRVEMGFADPVLKNREGTKTYTPAEVNPGYREIRLLWAK